MWWVLLFPACCVFSALGLAGVGGFDAGVFVDGVVGVHDVVSLFGGDGLAVGVAKHVVLAGAPAGGDAGQQGGGDVADRGVVVSLDGHGSFVFRGEVGVGFAGLVSGGEQGFTQELVAGFGQPVLVVCLSGLVEFGDQARVGADRGQGVEAVWVTDAPGDHSTGDRSNTRGPRR